MSDTTSTLRITMSQKQPVEPVIFMDKKRIGMLKLNAIVEQWRGNAPVPPTVNRQPSIQQSTASLP